MIKHLFKLVWNRKRSNFLMVTEIFFSFLILFGISSLLVYFLKNYTKPMGYQPEKIWYVTVDWHQTPEEVVRPSLEQIVKRLKSLPEVENVALASGNVAYAFWQNRTLLKYNNQSFSSSYSYQQYGNFQEVLDLKMASGRWFKEEDAFSDRKPIVITQDLAKSMFGSESALGKIIGDHDDQSLIIGVVKEYRSDGELHEDDGTAFYTKSLADTSAWLEKVLFVRIAPGTTPAFEEKLVKEATAIGKGWEFNVRKMEDMRTSYYKTFLTPTLAFVLISAFLILNVALGIFGVLWYNINKRYPEIGLRRALGASATSIYNQFVGEVMVVATLGLALGCFFAVQFPMLGAFSVKPDVYLIAILIAIVLIYSLVLVCAFYPSRQAASIHPAVALHEE